MSIIKRVRYCGEETIITALHEDSIIFPPISSGPLLHEQETKKTNKLKQNELKQNKTKQKPADEGLKKPGNIIKGMLAGQFNSSTLLHIDRAIRWEINRWCGSRPRSRNRKMDSRHVSNMLISILQACRIRPQQRISQWPLNEYSHNLRTIVLVDREHVEKGQVGASTLLATGPRTKESRILSSRR